MKIYDISLPISTQTIVWPGDPNVQINTQFDNTSQSTNSSLAFSAHTGTHIDSPLHFLPNGKTVDEIDLEKINGPCQIINIKRSAPEISLKDLKNSQILPSSRILFKTGNSELNEQNQFNQNFCSLSPEVAQFLADRQVALVGIDYLSIEPYDSPGHPIHKLLLSNQIVILEGLYLDHVPAGEYELVCLPLKLKNLEAAPCRAILKTK